LWPSPAKPGACRTKQYWDNKLSRKHCKNYVILTDFGFLQKTHQKHCDPPPQNQSDVAQAWTETKAIKVICGEIYRFSDFCTIKVKKTCLKCIDVHIFDNFTSWTCKKLLLMKRTHETIDLISEKLMKFYANYISKLC
jgi:hypothetical protein